jgi:hypothetical protein
MSLPVPALQCPLQTGSFFHPPRGQASGVSLETPVRVADNRSGCRLLQPLDPLTASGRLDKAQQFAPPVRRAEGGLEIDVPINRWGAVPPHARR